MFVSLCSAVEDQFFTRGTTDGAGGAIFAWNDFRNGPSFSDIYAQRVDADGNVLWAGDGVPVDTSASVQQFVMVASDGAGGAYVMWLDQGANPDAVRLARIDGSGSAVWPASKTLSSSTWDARLTQYRGQMVEDGAGGVIAVWHHIDGTSVAQRVAPSGTPMWGPGGKVVAAATTGSYAPTLAADGAGGALIAWRDFRTFSNGNIFAQKLDAAGTPQWTVNGVPVCEAPGEQGDPVTVYDGAGGAIIAWSDRRSVCDAYAQRLDALGAPQWTPDGVLVGPLANFCTSQRPLMVADGSGGAILTWADGLGFGIQAQRIDGSGSPLWGVSPIVVCGAPAAQSAPQLVADGGGGAIIAWVDRRNSAVNDIYAQRLDASGVAQWQANGDTVSWGTGDSFQPDLVPVGPGEVIVGIDADQGGAERRNIIVHRFPPPATTDVPGAAGGVELALASAPNPTVRRATLTLALSHPARVSLSLFDAAGRRVRRLHDGVLPTGKHVFHWDGTGEDGSRSPAGVYFARLAGEGRNRTTRVVVLGP